MMMENFNWRIIKLNVSELYFDLKGEDMKMLTIAEIKNK